MKKQKPSKEHIEYICSLYSDIYDDRIEDSRPPAAGDDFQKPGEDWMPGQVADHKSLAAFQKELKDKGIKLCSSKIRKILITGGCWTTERSQGIAEMFERLTTAKDSGGLGLTEEQAVKRIAYLGRF